jgi:hypothetical protein
MLHLLLDRRAKTPADRIGILLQDNIKSAKVKLYSDW